MSLRNLGLDASDAIAVAGFVSLVYGVAQCSAAGAYMVAGGLLMAAALVPTLRKRKG